MSEYIMDFGTSTYKSSDGLVYAPVEQLREEIVRCRDCKLFDSHYLKCFRPVLYFDDDYNPHWTDETTFTAVTDATPDGFCAWGERK